MSKSTHDRGPTPYFHGRRDVLHDFGQQLTGAEDSRDGTIFLIQGAPGSGKTALLYECSKLARKHHWQVAEIHPDALWSTASLMRSLGRGGEYQISERIGTVDAVVVKGEYTSVPVPRTTISILQEMWYPLLLVLDEAQTLGASSRPSPEQSIHATNTLKEIHNGGLGRPVRKAVPRRILLHGLTRLYKKPINGPAMSIPMQDTPGSIWKRITES